MTLYEFEQQLRVIQTNQRILSSLYDSLAHAREDQLAVVGSGAIDYSKDRIQASADPDAAIINAIARADELVNRLVKKINELEEEDAAIKDLLWEADGLGGEILRLCFLEGMRMGQIAQRLNYDRSYCYKMWREKINELYEIYKMRHQ